MKKQCHAAVSSFALATAFILFCVSPASAGEQKRELVTISSIEELTEYAGKSGNRVRMEPGLYYMTDYIPLEKISEKKRKIKQANAESKISEAEARAFISFNGHDNVFDLRGVTIVFDTKLRFKLGMYNEEFRLSGDGNELKGLTIVNTGTGDGSSRDIGGCVFGVSGNGNTMRNCTLVVKGSNTYGHGGAFTSGSASGSFNGLGVHNGDDNRFFGCNVYMRAFGHAVYLNNAENTYFEDCYVEGEMRTTDDILAETSGRAYERDFRIHPKRKNWPGYMGITDEDGKLKPGGILSLAADGYRFYSPGKTTFVDCTAKNMRRGFAVDRAGARSGAGGGPAYLENCVATGCGNNFSTGEADDVLKNCRGDAKYGPLLWSTHGKAPSVELYLLPDESELKGQFYGSGLVAIGKSDGANITIKPWQGKERESEKPIKVGVHTVPSVTQDMPPNNHYLLSVGGNTVRNVTLINKTTMPVKISRQVKNCEVHTKGEVLKNNGTDIDIEKLEDTDSSE